MMLVDANVLLYAVDRTTTRHDIARAWITEVLNHDALRECESFHSERSLSSAEPIHVVG